MLIFGAVRGGKFPFQLDGEEEFQLKTTRAKIKFAVIASQTAVFALRTELTEVEQIAISSTLKLEYTYSSYHK